MTTAVASVSSPAPTRAKRPAGRWFYTAAGALMLVLTIIGFRHFFFHGQSHPGREIPPPIRWLIIVHGMATSAWILVIVVQPFLIATRRHRIHMALGRIAAGVAAAVFGLGVAVGIGSARVAPPDLVIWGLSPKQFMAVPLGTVLIFAALVAVGVWKRRKPAIHRPVMLLATLAIIGAAVSRIDPLSALYVGTVWESLFGPFFATLVLAVVLAGIRCAVTRSLDRVLVIGVAGLIVACWLIMAVARTSAWSTIAATLAG